MNRILAADNGLLDRLSAAPWWWSMIAGLLLLAASYGMSRMKGRTADDDDASCIVGLISIVFALAGAYALISGLFGW